MSNLRLFAEEGHYAEVPAEQLLHARKNWFIGWKCLAGTQSLFIDQDGVVFSAGCKSTGQYGRRSSLGNVFKEFRIESAPVNCARRFCESEFDLAIPKFHRPKHRIVLDGGIAVPEISQPVAVMGSDIKRVLWNLSLFESKSLTEWKLAVHKLELFCKGESVRLILQDPPSQSKDFFDFLNFLTEEKGHLVTVEGFLHVNIDFYIRSLAYGDLCLKYDGEENVFFRHLDKLGDEFQQQQHKRKIEVQLDQKNTDYDRIRYRLTSDPYKNWLEAGFYPGQATQPVKQVVEPKPEAVIIKESSVKRVKILLFIPMRNCSGTIGKVIAGLEKQTLDYVDEILILDNDSTDDSMQMAAEAIKTIKSVKVVLRKNAQNYGFGGSHKLAFQYAELNRMDYLLIVHGDNSGSPDDFIPVLKSGEYKNFDMVLSSRLSLFSNRKNYPLYRFLSNWILNFISSLVTFSPITDFSGGPVNLFRVQSFINKFENPVKRFDDRISFQQHALLYVNYRKGLTLFVPVKFAEAGGKSFYTAATQFLRSLNLLMKYLFAKNKLFR
ncbi:MAG: glycosyltransferase family 2 protein [Bdellovibrionota bacterium]